MWLQYDITQVQIIPNPTDAIFQHEIDTKHGWLASEIIFSDIKTMAPRFRLVTDPPPFSGRSLLLDL